MHVLLWMDDCLVVALVLFACWSMVGTIERQVLRDVASGLKVGRRCVVYP